MEGQQERERERKTAAEGQLRERVIRCQKEPESCSNSVNETMMTLQDTFSLSSNMTPDCITECNLESSASIVCACILRTKIDHFGSKSAGILVNSCCLVENPSHRLPKVRTSPLLHRLLSSRYCHRSGTSSICAGQKLYTV